jgi:hypothetical protein
MRKRSGIAALLPFVFAGLFPPVEREAKVDFETEKERIIYAEEADRRNREKFPSRKKRLRSKEAKP